MRRRLIPLLVAAVCWAASPLAATWSIVAVNVRTGEVAVGIATCLENFNLRRRTLVVIPEHGVAAAQCLVGDGSNRLLIWEELQRGTPVHEILSLLQAKEPAGFQTRQYGIVDAVGRPGTHTGTSCGEWKGGVIGQAGDVVYAIQGNVLAGQPVVLEAEQALVNTPGDLAEKMMAAMEAARDMGGDGRCSCNPSAPASCGSPPANFTKAAHVAALIVSRPGEEIVNLCNANSCARGDFYLTINLDNLGQNSPEPIGLMRTEFDLWRQSLAGRPDAYESGVWVATPEVEPGSTQPVSIVLDLADVFSNPLTSGGATITVEHDARSAGLSTVQQVIDHNDGTYTIELLPGNAPGLDLLRIEVDDGIMPVTLWPPARLLHTPPPVPSVNDLEGVPGLAQAGDDAQAFLLGDGLTAYYLNQQGTSPPRLLRATRASAGAPFGTPAPVSVTNGQLYELIDFWVSDDELEIVAGAVASGSSVEQLFELRRASTAVPFDEPQLLATLDSGSHDGGPWVTRNGLEMLFHSRRDGTYDLWRTRRLGTAAGNQWLPPERLDSLDRGGDERYPLLVDGETRLLFAGGPGGDEKLFFSDRAADGGWRAPAPHPGGVHPAGTAVVPSAFDSGGDAVWLTLENALGAAVAQARASRGALSASAASVSASAGGRVDFGLDAGPSWAGANYRLLASGSGSHPGLPWLDAVAPIVPDPVTVLVLRQANGPLLPGFQGTLDPSGQGAAQFLLPPGAITNPSLLDRDYTLAFLAVRAIRAFASNAVVVRLDS